ncbi:MAG: hypothetical protein NTW73_00390 [Candidatus Parcubacteria bacterium]|nr:hypothetical protein [Candidatus Parcubacteria bacterium]
MNKGINKIAGVIIVAAISMGGIGGYVYFKNKSVCDGIQYRELSKDDCYYWNARNKQNLSICEKINEQEKKRSLLFAYRFY